MRKEDFFEVLGELDDDIVKGAKTPMKKQLNWKTLWGMVACLCIAITAATVFFHQKSANNFPSTPMGQGYFNATVIEISDNTILVKCTKNFYENVSIGTEVKVSLNTLSDEEIPSLQIGDNIRILYMGLNTDTYPVTLRDTVSIFLLDENENPIV